MSGPTQSAGNDGRREGTGGGAPRNVPAQQMNILNEELRFQNCPFGHSRQAVENGTSDGVTIKQLLFGHYVKFIAEVWRDFENWRARVSGAPLRLLHPDPKITPIFKDVNLLNASTALPSLEQLASFMRPVERDYVEQLRGAPVELRTKAALSLVGLTWKTFLYKWELERRCGKATTISDSRIDLYQRCRDLLVKEVLENGQIYLTRSKLPQAEVCSRLSAVEKDIRKGYALTNIMGEAMSFASQVWSEVPDSLHPFVAYAAVTTGPAAKVIITNLIQEGEATAVESENIDDIFPKVISESLTAPYKRYILERMAEERAAGNSSGNPEVAGCPALGTPAFMGSRKLVAEVRAVVGF
jgi:hypothetical protein